MLKLGQQTGDSWVPRKKHNLGRRLGSLLASTALAAATLSSVHAQTFWEGTVSSDWADGNNWDTGVVPTVADNVIIDETLNIATVGTGVTAAADIISIGQSKFARLSVEGGGTLNLGSDLIVGAAAEGRFDVSSGGIVSGDLAAIGFGVNAEGLATVSGAGSIWAATAIAVGYQSAGTLIVADGGNVLLSAVLNIGHSSNGLLQITSAGNTLVDKAVFGKTVNGVGNGLVTGLGSALNVSGELIVGEFGTGSLTVSQYGTITAGDLYVGETNMGTMVVDSGATVFSNYTTIGDETSSVGNVTVTGDGSAWHTTGIDVGYHGYGSLVIADGGYVSGSGYIGSNTGSGSVLVTGPTSVWDATEFIAAYRGHGELTISDGGLVSSGLGAAAVLEGSSAVVRIEGPGSAWVSSLFELGTAGSAEVVVDEGGGILGEAIIIAFAPTANSVVTIAGQGSTMTAGNLLTVADQGTASLVVKNGGNVTVNGGAGTLTVAESVGSHGNVQIGLDEAPGTLSVQTVAFGDGEGIVYFRHTDQNYSFAPTFSGLGTIVQTAGHTILTGDSSAFGGTTNVFGGKLSVNGKLGGEIGIHDGGTLGGNGMVSMINVLQYGTIAPGNSIGTLNVTGDVTFQAGSVYRVEVNGSGNVPGVNNDWVHAGGAISIDSMAVVEVLAENGTDDGSTFQPSTTYRILTADSGLTGSFGTLYENFAFLDGTLSYDANNAYLTLVRNSQNFPDAALTPNQKSSAGAVESLGPGNPLYDAFVPLTAEQAQAASDAVSGEFHASLKSALVDDSRFPREAANARVRAAFGSVASGESGYAMVQPGAAAAAWIRGFGAWGSLDGDSNAAQFDRSVGGVLAGADAEVSDGLRLGLLAGYTHTSADVDARRSSASVDTGHVGAYGGADFGALGLRFGAFYGFHNVDTDRVVAFPGLSETLSASYDARTLQAFAEAGYRLDHGPVALEPFANLAHVNLSTDSFAESAGAAALSARGQNADVTFTTLGLRAETALPSMAFEARLRGMAGWRQAFGDWTPAVTHSFVAGGNAFTVTGAPMARDALVLEAGFDAKLGPAAVLGVSYSGQFGGSASDHTVNANLAIRF